MKDQLLNRPVIATTADVDSAVRNRFGPSDRGSIAPALVKSTPIRDMVSAEEWEERVNLAACYRLMAHYDMLDMIYNHITARVPGHPEQFLINAYGLHYTEISASNLHKVDHDGNIVLRASGTHLGMNHAGFVIHGAVHSARPDVNCVVHTHTRAGMAVSAMKCGLLPLSLHGMRFATGIGYHDCEGTVVEMDEQGRITQSLGHHDVMILRNHGLLACGPNISEAFNAIYTLERACQTQVDAMSCGTELVLPSPVAEESTAHLMKRDVRRPYGVMEWPAMRRLLDRQDPSYQH